MTTSFVRASALLAVLLVAAASPAPARQSASAADDLAKQFRGARLGMARDEIHALVGKPDDKDDQQEVFSISRSRRIRVYYDKDLKASAIVSTFIGDGAGAPAPETVLGTAATPAADGSVSASVRRPEEGYSLSYNRIVADPPMVMITIQKL